MKLDDKFGDRLVVWTSILAAVTVCALEVMGLLP